MEIDDIELMSEDEALEIAVRKAFQASDGFRYKLHDKMLPGKPDLVFFMMEKKLKCYDFRNLNQQITGVRVVFFKKHGNLIYALWVFQNIMSAYPAHDISVFCNLIGRPVRPGYPAFPNISGMVHFFGI